jgi:short-subunit dehydrogenase
MVRAMELRGSTVLLTGATGGIGHAIARRLHREGASLTLTGRRTDVLEPLAAELGARATAVDFRVDQIDKALEVNLRAPMVLSRVLGERMAVRGRGHIVLISSLAGKSSQPQSSVYSATKFGLRGFGQGLRGDLGPRGVGVSVVFPGFIRDAGMFHESGTKLPWGVGTSTPDEVAAAVVRAITQDKGEVDVAPIGMRAGATFACVAPGLSAKVARRLGGDKVTDQLVSGQESKR